MRIKHVYQEDDTGCGIAAVAMVLNKNYHQVRRVAIKKNIVTEKFLGTYYVDLQKLLAFFKVNGVRKGKAKSWKDIPRTSIVGLKEHWVVLVRTNNCIYILDPADKRGKRIRTFSGRKFYQYIEIHW